MITADDPITVDEVINTLYTYADHGIYAPRAARLWQALKRRPGIGKAFREGKRTGRLVTRCVADRTGARHRYAALPQYADRLPLPRGAR